MNKFRSIVKFALIGTLILSVLINVYLLYKGNQSKAEKEVIIRYDTLKITDTKKVDSLQVVISDLSNKPIATIIRNKVVIDTQTIYVRDTLRDTAFIYLPIEQTTYAWVDTAQIWISGYNAKLDSAKFATKIYQQAPKRSPTILVGAGIGAKLYDQFKPSININCTVLLGNVGFELGFDTFCGTGFECALYGALKFKISK